jgi:hypothetical protein
MCNELHAPETQASWPHNLLRSLLPDYFPTVFALVSICRSISSIFNRLRTLCTILQPSPFVFNTLWTLLPKTRGGVPRNRSFRISRFDELDEGRSADARFDMDTGCCISKVTHTLPLRQRVVPPFQLHMRYALLLSATSSFTVHLK